MAYKDVSSTYKETTIKTAGQGQLIVMLYDEAIKQLGIAIDFLKQNQDEKRDPGKIEQISKSIMKTEEIITELMISLDFDQGGEIAKQLFALYTWFNRELVEANISQDFNRINTVKTMLAELRNTWNTISQNAPAHSNREASSNMAVGINIAG